MAEKIATREAYGKALAALAEKYPDLVCFDADLAGATMTKYFKAACPERFFDMGIAEADMVGVAAGMSLCGFKPFVNTFAMFAAGRAWEQVRNSVAYPHLNVKVVGSHGGLSVGEDGATHQCIEDFAIMRAIPGMLVLCPCDGNEMRLAVEALVNYEGPAYMRLGRLAVETVTDSIPGYKFELGKGATLRDGTDVTIIAVGMNVQMALAAADKLAAEGISARVIDMHTIKPLDTELVLKAAKETGAIVTTEEANVLGGLGAAVAEYLSENHPVPVVRHGVNDEFGRSGKAPLVLDAYGINADGTIEESAKEQVRALLRRTFRPEFLNRLDEIVFYKPLTKENVTKIIDLQIAKLNDRLADQQIRCELTPAAKAAIVDAAYDPQYGARPLRRYVQHTVETMLSKRLLRGDVTPGQTVTVDAENGELVMK